MGHRAHGTEYGIKWGIPVPCLLQLGEYLFHEFLWEMPYKGLDAGILLEMNGMHVFIGCFLPVLS